MWVLTRLRVVAFDHDDWLLALLAEDVPLTSQIYARAEVNGFEG